MKLNVGGIDRVLRILVGLVLIGLAATGTVGWWGWLGIVPLATGLFSVRAFSCSTFPSAVNRFSAHTCSTWINAHWRGQ